LLESIKWQTLTSNENREIIEAIRKFAILNALLHGGKAQAGPVIGKLLAELPHLKPKIKEISQQIAKVVEEVNALSLDQQRRVVEEKWPEALVKEKAREERVLPPLPNVEKYERIVTRFRRIPTVFCIWVRQEP